MDTTRNNQLDFRTRLIAFLVVLVVGFALGWFKGTDGTGTNPDASTGIVATDASGETGDARTQDTDAAQDDQQETPSQNPEDNQQAPTAEPDDARGDAGQDSVAPTRGPTVDADGWYTSKDEVALYIHSYGRLPGNFISKTKARARGWDASLGNLDEVCPGMSIGGSRYYDYDEDLPYQRGRTWTECDINYHGGYRGAERIVFSNDGLIYYTADHYETFEQLY